MFTARFKIEICRLFFSCELNLSISARTPQTKKATQQLCRPKCKAVMKKTRIKKWSSWYCSQNQMFFNINLLFCSSEVAELFNSFCALWFVHPGGAARFWLLPFFFSFGTPWEKKSDSVTVISPNEVNLRSCRWRASCVTMCVSCDWGQVN